MIDDRFDSLFLAFCYVFFLFLCFYTDALYDGRLYRCDIKFSGNELQENNLRSDSVDQKQESDEDSSGWEEREASRTHSVKFTDDVEENKEVSDNKYCFNFKCLFNCFKKKHVSKSDSYYMLHSELEYKDVISNVVDET